MPRTLPPLHAALVLVAAAGCRTTHEVPAAGDAGGGSAPAAAPRAAAARDEALRAVVADLERGRVEEAWEKLGALVLERQVARAREAFAEGRPEDGLLAVDEALELAPREPRTLLLKAEGSLALAEKKIAEGGPASLIEGALLDARAYFARAPEEPGALLGASRAAILMGDYADALELARRADRALEREPAPGELSFLPERVLSEAAFRAYTEAKLAEDAAAPELAATAEDALGRLLGRASDDPWAWGTLADLQEWEERFPEARATLLRGLERVPHDPDLLERLARVARKEGGPALAAGVFGEYAARFPEATLARWYEAVQRFDGATEGLMARFAAEEGTEAPGAAQTIEGFAAAEEVFRDVRAADPDYAEACLGYEVVCRAGRGWTHYQDGDLEAAEAAFRSMDEVVERGLEWKIEGRILSGVDGLHLVGTRYNDREDWLAAARVYAFLHEYQPEDAVWANNTGFFYRDAAVALEAAARRACALAEGASLDDEELAALGLAADAGAAAARARANELALRARELMAKSWQGYRDATALAPEDVRVVNDAALVQVYYLHEELDLAEELLRRCLELGERQLEDDSLEEDARWELRNAWGDAYQNLGVLLALWRDDPAGAVALFERSVAIGPEPRPTLSNFWIPLLRGELPRDQDYGLYSLGDWGSPCTP